MKSEWIDLGVGCRGVGLGWRKGIVKWRWKILAWNVKMDKWRWDVFMRYINQSIWPCSGKLYTAGAVWMHWIMIPCSQLNKHLSWNKNAIFTAMLKETLSAFFVLNPRQHCGACAIGHVIYTHPSIAIVTQSLTTLSNAEKLAHTACIKAKRVTDVVTIVMEMRDPIDVSVLYDWQASWCIVRDDI